AGPAKDSLFLLRNESWPNRGGEPCRRTGRPQVERWNIHPGAAGHKLLRALMRPIHRTGHRRLAVAGAGGVGVAALDAGDPRIVSAAAGDADHEPDRFAGG